MNGRDGFRAVPFFSFLLELKIVSRTEAIPPSLERSLRNVTKWASTSAHFLKCSFCSIPLRSGTNVDALRLAGIDLSKEFRLTPTAPAIEAGLRGYLLLPDWERTRLPA